ncbi:MAG: LuxR C-terminal-related transcriptional regulator [Janthinobacterium lividum]
MPKEVADQLSWDGPALSPADEMGVERATQLGNEGERGKGERVTEIILADNQAVFRAGAARVLAHENDLKVVGECTDVQRMKELAVAFARPIVIFPSSFTPELEDTLRWLRASGARSVIILEHSVTLPERLARQSNGFLTRSVTGPQLLDTLRRVAIGQHVPQRTGVKEMPSPDHAGTQVVQRLTPKELQIVALVSEGAKNREIGVRLGTKEQVVKNYLRSIYDKVGVSDRLELALYTVHHRTLNEAVERVRATLARSA